MRRQRHRPDGYLALVGAIVIFGLNYPVLKYLLGSLNPHLVNAVRLFLGFLTLACLYPFVRSTRTSLRKVFAENWPLVCLVGFVGYYLSPVCYLIGMQRSTASNAAIILASAPVWTVLLSWVLDLDELSGKGWIALGVTLVGSVLVGLVPGGTLPDTSLLVGNGFLLLDAVLWGGFVALKKQLMTRTSPLQATVLCLFVALPFLFVTAAPYVSIESDLGTLTRTSNVLGLVFSGAINMGIALVWWNVAVDKLGPARSGIYSNGIPIVGLVASVVFLAEAVTVVKVVGISIVLVGVFLLTRDERIDLDPTLGKPLP